MVKDIIVKFPQYFLSRNGVLIKDCHNIRDSEKVFSLDVEIDSMRKGTSAGRVIIEL